MAVPKKRTSKAKKNARKANWKNQARFEAQKALSLARSVLTRKSNGFIYNLSETSDIPTE
uniref:Large ribosomal subunit protein bL32c n=1 Tax=Pyropia perforata TaxID=182771 RepID=A0A023HQS4_PYRPE|nr:50S ribosomal protein L32 [Neoporphyra perforata]AGQ17046.1 50S ribosomal protein L32 [Neoporphyra perforata]AHB34985.1 50S ribosomal protein L32 [Neoporphyra perforata]AHB35194.1 50S ribosomal protein L32 [Neoporphyra perforata]AIA19356.1 50S ribosomal protein L32 [Neoporphyra perforata]AIA19565.1 50S ribosomal protein L32 [Neoporphyra perforata]